jgi:hypothetical protein
VQRLPLAEWLAEELHRQFGVNTNTTRFLIENDHVLPLLDGLDEVACEHRDGCVEAINTFRTKHGLLPLAICSRSEDYAALTKKLHLQTAVTIQPLKFEQVDCYLAQAGAPLERVRKLVTEDKTLQGLLNTPLMLSIMQLAFSGSMDAAKSLETGTLEERRRNLFNTYIERMFKRRKTSASYSPEQTKTWLSRLARSMKEGEQSLFYLELMQPSLLPKKLQIMQRILSLIAPGIIGGLLGGLFLVVSYGILVELKTAGNIKLAEGALEFYMSPPLLRIALFLGLLFGLLNGYRLRGIEGTIEGTIGGAIGGVLLGLFSGLYSPMLVGLYNSKTLFQEMSNRIVPNEGIYRSMKNALFISLAVWLSNGVLGLVLFLDAIIFFGVILRISEFLVFLIFWMICWMILGMIPGMIFGGYACIQHAVLRFLLWQDGFAPLRYVRFLDHAAELLFLRKAGGGYIFVHRMIMEHFAELQPSALLNAKQNNAETIDATLVAE